MRLISYGYRSVVALRRLLYRCGIFKASRLPAPVLSIGNLTAGGAGKTPATLFFAERLAPFHHVGILSRGYRSPAEHKKEPTLVSRKGTLLCNPSACGDEPFLLAKNLPDATVVAGKNRFADGELALRQGVTILLLDDGFQHCQLHRDSDILILDAHNPFPPGRLRDFPWQLKKVGLLLLNSGTTPLPKEALSSLIAQLRRLSQAPLLLVSTRVAGLFDADDRPLTLSPGEKVVAACGIAQPLRFEKTLHTALHTQVVARYTWPDHRMPSLAQLEACAEKGKADGATHILCTEKDRVRFESFPPLCLPWGWVKIRLQVDEGEEFLESYLNEVTRPSWSGF